MQIVASLLVLAFAAALFGGLWFVLTEPVVVPIAVEGEPYRPRHYSRLPKRPEGRQALKAEIAQAVDADPVLIPAPPIHLHVHREHDDWRFDTDEWEIARDDFFADQPDDQAVQVAWRGTGLVRVEEISDEVYAAVMSG